MSAESALPSRVLTQISDDSCAILQPQPPPVRKNQVGNDGGLCMNFNLPNNENLPSPPVLTHWLFEQPLPLLIIIVSIGAITAMLMFSQGNRQRAMRALAISAGAVLIVLGISRLVTTDRERVANMSREFIDRIIAADTRALDPMIGESMTLLNDGRTIGRDRNWFLAVAGSLKGEIEDYSFTSRGTVVNDPAPGEARSRFTVRTSFGPQAIVANQTVYSSWELSFRRNSAGNWKITGLDCLSVLGQRPDSQWVGWGEQQLGRRR